MASLPPSDAETNSASHESGVVTSPEVVAEFRQDEPAPAAPSLPGVRKTWHAGTLVYTGAGLAVLLFWLLWGDLAWQFKERSVHPVMQLLFKKFGASDMLVGLLIGSFPQFLGMIVQPIISYKSDRFRSRWGRRIPFLIVSTPISALSMIALAFCPAMGAALHAALGAQSPGLNSSVLILFGVFWAIFELSTIAANSVFGALVNDVVPRPLLGRFGSAMRAISLLAGMAFSWYLMGWIKTHYVWIFGAIGLIYGIGVTMMCVMVKEGEYPPPPEEETHANRLGSFFGGVKTYFRECFSNPYYVCFFIMQVLMQMSLNVVNLYNIFFSESFHVDTGLLGKYFFTTYAISLVLSIPLGWLADLFHPLRVGLVVLVVHGAVLLWGGLCIRDAHTFAIGFITTGVLAGTWMTSTASLQQRIFPRLRYAQFDSAMWLVGHLALIVVAPIMGEILDLTGHVYRYTYLTSFVLVVFTFLTGLVVYRKFVQLGGPHHYVAPE